MSHYDFWTSTLAIAFKQQKIYYILILTLITYIIVPIVVAHLTIVFTENGNSALTLLILDFVNNLLVMYILNPLYINLATFAEIKIIKKEHKKYNNISFEDKTIKTSSEHKEALCPYTSASYMLIEWGMPNALSLFGTIVATLYVFYYKDLLLILISVIIFFGIIYYFFISKKQKQLTTLDKKLKQKNQMLFARIQMYLIPFQYKEYTPKDIIKNYVEIKKNQKTITKQYTIISSFTSTANNIISFIVCYTASNDVNNFLLLSIFMNQLTRDINNTMWFINQYNRYKNDYDNYKKFMSNVSFNDEPEKINIDDNGLVIKNVNIKRGDYVIKCNDIIKINKNDKILVTGPTGHGKSSFVKALFGLIPGITLENNNPNNYYHTVADYYQEIKEKMPSSKVTIRDFFKDQQDNDLIKTYLEYAWSQDNEYQGIIANIKAKAVDSNDYECPVIVGHEYDLPINETLSGGQKSRLILWSRCYQLDQLDKQILILDEPIPDVDYNNYLYNIQSIFKKYDNKMIIMIAHLHEQTKKDLNIDWNKFINIENGLIKLNNLI
ncbi:ABC transporter [Hokovirus HKV1]|uniref:ABC transporter n=1 Tax=Hokovirus HKV1 TaxID=1977638 RepID=A0A1V0SGG7_9VIRU|nr:ABC transporter [Hokovirus HKV1]